MKYCWALIVVVGLMSMPIRADETKVNIGVLLCLSGECAEWGDASLKGLMLARDEINHRGGVLGAKIQFIVEDTGEAVSARKAITAFHKLVASNISLFIGPSWTPASLALAPLLAKDQSRIMISPSVGVAAFNEASRNIFNTMPHSEERTRKLAQFARKNGVTTVGIFSSLQPWEKLMGDIFEEEFKKLGGAIRVKIEADPNTKVLRQESLRLLNGNPDMIFLSNFGQSGIAAKTLREFGFKGKFYAALLDTSRIEQASGSFEGIISAQFPEASEEFSRNFARRYQHQPQVSSDTAYDALHILATAIEQARSFEQKKVLDQLFKISWQGASGVIEFDKDGGVQGVPHFTTVRNGKIVVLP